ncbi:collagen alpha-1(I) chain-like [Sarcophilus harrisii]|uniref:collagen alpha-1(I) chain-like n=1 Tax=Sarcophilus harrisii TaxID=9305 RepID=UPI001301B431|nr:collagen alpha-1(I) chain-like [Sarcophilus harrisii]
MTPARSAAAAAASAPSDGAGGRGPGAGAGGCPLRGASPWRASCGRPGGPLPLLLLAVPLRLPPAGRDRGSALRSSPRGGARASPGTAAERGGSGAGRGAQGPPQRPGTGAPEPGPDSAGIRPLPGTAAFVCLRCSGRVRWARREALLGKGEGGGCSGPADGAAAAGREAAGRGCCCGPGSGGCSGPADGAAASRGRRTGLLRAGRRRDGAAASRGRRTGLLRAGLGRMLGAGGRGCCGPPLRGTPPARAAGDRLLRAHVRALGGLCRGAGARRLPGSSAPAAAACRAAPRREDRRAGPRGPAGGSLLPGRCAAAAARLLRAKARLLSPGATEPSCSPGRARDSSPSGARAQPGPDTPAGRGERRGGPWEGAGPVSRQPLPPARPPSLPPSLPPWAPESAGPGRGGCCILQPATSRRGPGPQASSPIPPPEQDSENAPAPRPPIPPSPPPHPHPQPGAVATAHPAGSGQRPERASPKSGRRPGLSGGRPGARVPPA